MCLQSRGGSNIKFGVVQTFLVNKNVETALGFILHGCHTLSLKTKLSDYKLARVF